MRINPTFIFNIQPPKPSPFDFGKNPFLNYPIKNDSFEKTTTQTPPSFKGFACDTGDFKPRNLYNMPCASCGKKCLTNLQVDIATNKLIGKNSDELTQELLKKYDYYRPIEKMVVDGLIVSAEAYPNKNIEELIKHSAIEHRKKLEKIQKEILNDIKNESRLLDARSAKPLCTLIDNSMLEIQNSNETNYFKRKSFLNNLENISRNFKNKEAFNRILEKAQKLPTSGDSVSAFYAKYSRRSEKEIANRLYTTARGTTEHIKPASEGGPNNTENYMVMCGDCNSKRSSMPYSEWMKIRPDMPENFKKYLDEVILRLKSGELPNTYASYPSEVCKAVDKATSGVIKLEIEDGIIEQKRERVRKKPPSAEQRAEEALKILDKKKEELNNLEKIKEELEQDPQYLAIAKYFAFEEQLGSLKTRKNEASSRINAVRNELKIKASREKRLNELIKAQSGNDPLFVRTTKDGSTMDGLRLKIKKAEGLEEEMEIAKNNYCLISSKMASLGEEKASQLKMFTLPEDIKQEEKKLQEMLDTRVKFRVAIRQKQLQGIEDKKEFNRAGKLKNRLQTLENKNTEIEACGNLGGRENQKHLANYLELGKKVKVLGEISTESLKSIIKSKSGVNPVFIKDEALSSINKKLEELKQFEVVQHRENADQIKTLQEEINAIHKGIKTRAQEGKSLETLAQELEALEQEAQSEKLKVQIILLKNSYQAVQDKIDNLNIDERIKITKEGVNVALGNYKRLAKLSSKSNVVNNT